MSYNTGTLMHMGPGMFPFMLGVTLTFVGVLIFGTAVVTPLATTRTSCRSNKEWLRLGLHPGRPDPVHHPRRIFRHGARDILLRVRVRAR